MYYSFWIDYWTKLEHASTFTYAQADSNKAVQCAADPEIVEWGWLSGVSHTTWRPRLGHREGGLRGYGRGMCPLLEESAKMAKDFLTGLGLWTQNVHKNGLFYAALSVPGQWLKPIGGRGWLDTQPPPPISSCCRGAGFSGFRRTPSPSPRQRKLVLHVVMHFIYSWMLNEW